MTMKVKAVVQDGHSISIVPPFLLNTINNSSGVG
jgi:hypothetical protein